MGAWGRFLCLFALVAEFAGAVKEQTLQKHSHRHRAGVKSKQKFERTQEKLLDEAFAFLHDQDPEVHMASSPATNHPKEGLIPRQKVTNTNAQDIPTTQDLGAQEAAEEPRKEAHAADEIHWGRMIPAAEVSKPVDEMRVEKQEKQAIAEKVASPTHAPVKMQVAKEPTLVEPGVLTPAPSGASSKATAIPPDTQAPGALEQKLMADIAAAEALKKEKDAVRKAVQRYKEKQAVVGKVADETGVPVHMVKEKQSIDREVEGASPAPAPKTAVAAAPSQGAKEEEQEEDTDEAPEVYEAPEVDDGSDKPQSSQDTNATEPDPDADPDDQQVETPELPFSELEPFGRKPVGEALTESSVVQSNAMVDQLERAEGAEEKRAVFRALTRLRGMALSSFDGIARSHTANIDDYAKHHQWRLVHPIKHLAEEESDVKSWAFPADADF